MPLKVDQFGIEFSVGSSAESGPALSSDDVCCGDANEQKRRQEDRLVERVTERVLAALRLKQER